MLGVTFIGLIVALLQHVEEVLASPGDNSWIYRKCFKRCLNANCSYISDESFAQKQPFHLRWLYWTCPKECDYMCMWKTVDAYERDGTAVPQFYGKWPFVRLLGIQEPASVVFSILNAIPYFIMVYQLRCKVPSSAPMYYIWHAYAAVAVNAWFWSVLFHTRDVDFTEMMDYVCAVSLVMFSVFVVWARILVGQPWWIVAGVGFGVLSFFTWHVHYLAFVHFDYGYNMKVNIMAAATNTIVWLAWCACVRSKQSYVWKMATTIAALDLLVLLEVLDFPPLWWTFDAHSLWHAGTCPLPFLLYSFAIDDCLYLLRERQSTGQRETKSPEHIKHSNVEEGNMIHKKSD